MKGINLVISTAVLFLLISCVEKPILVATGTYAGVVQEVNRDNQEILMEVASGELVTLTFTPYTKVMKNGVAVPFHELKEGTTVEIDIRNEEQHLNPVRIKIIG